jgi:hypothetical protein
MLYWGERRPVGDFCQMSDGLGDKSGVVLIRLFAA